MGIVLSRSGLHSQKNLQVVLFMEENSDRFAGSMLQIDR